MNKITFKKKVTKIKLKKFLKQIKDKDFLIHKDSNKSPWIYLDSKKFSFHFAYEKGNVIGSLITFNSIYSRHLYFLYINEKYRYKGIGSILIKKFLLNTKKIKTVHVLKSLKKILKFYIKNKFKILKKIESLKIKSWVSRCNKYDPKTYHDKYLLVKDYR